MERPVRCTLMSGLFRSDYRRLSSPNLMAVETFPWFSLLSTTECRLIR
jgi:hypothetical protein